MGNKAPDTAPSKDSQANQVLDSGEDQGTGGSGGGKKTLRITLIKLQIPAVAQAQQGNPVAVRLQGPAYEVFRAGQLLGTVPGSFKPRLAAHPTHRATIVEVSKVPQREKVVIEVSL